MKAFIVDDEAHCISHLQQALAREHADIQVQGIAGNVKESILAIAELRPELVFLDIELPDGTGFDVLEQFRGSSFQVIFTTAHHGYAIKAFRHNAIDYLLKPIQPVELAEAIAKAKSLNRKQSEKRLELMLQSLKLNDFSKLVIPSMDSFEFIDKKDIIYCMADNNYTEIVTTRHKFMSTYTLKRFEDLLPEPQFFRVHKSFIINIQFIKKLNKGENGTVILENGSEIPVSRRRREEFMATLGF